MSNKYVVVPDSFKGCLTSTRVADAVTEGIRANDADAEIISLPMSDGGEGMLEALTLTDSELVTCSSYDPLMRRTDVKYGIKGDTAYIESARTIGISMLTAEELNPVVATSYGLGVVITDAVDRGCRNITVGLGGTATCDAGIGMLKAINDRYSQDGHFDDNVQRQLKDIHFTILCDVDNPLLGSNGAAQVFAPQKGASPADVETLEWRISKFADMSSRHFGYDCSTTPSAGAAGGLGYAFMQYLKADTRSGAEYILRHNHYDSLVSDAHMIITGEGRADKQTLMGKLPFVILRHSAGIPVYLVAGSVSDAETLVNAGFASVIGINPHDMPLEECMKDSTAYNNIVKSVSRLIR